MAKKIVGFVKLQVPAGKANPSPPIGPALGQRGLNIMEFCKAFNAQTQGLEPGLPIPVVITAFADKSFTFVMKTPPATILIKKAAKIERARRCRIPTRSAKSPVLRPKRSPRPRAGSTAADMDAAVRTIAGSARSMGITVEGCNGQDFETRQIARRQSRAAENLLARRRAGRWSRNAPTPSSTNRSMSRFNSASMPRNPTRWFADRW